MAEGVGDSQSGSDALKMKLTVTVEIEHDLNKHPEAWLTVDACDGMRQYSTSAPFDGSPLEAPLGVMLDAAREELESLLADCRLAPH